MKFWEAMREMQENGEKVRLKGWPSFTYMYLKNGELLLYQDERSVSGDLPGLITQVWDLYAEPKRTYTWVDVVKGWKEGKIYTRLSSNQEWRFYDEELNCIVDEDNVEAAFSIDDFEATDWIEVKE